MEILKLSTDTVCCADFLKLTLFMLSQLKKHNTAVRRPETVNFSVGVTTLKIILTAWWPSV